METPMQCLLFKLFRPSLTHFFENILPQKKKMKSTDQRKTFLLQKNFVHVKTYLSDDVSLNVSVSAIIVPASLYISESLSRSLALLVPFNTATIK